MMRRFLSPAGKAVVSIYILGDENGIWTTLYLSSQNRRETSWGRNILSSASMLRMTKTYFSAHNSSGSAEWTHSQDIRLQF